ncbi:hypothetical protein AB0I89_24150 [Micromonospora sp. NPDC049801]|uniref:hypothetical protein n=1 Tax=unclassified Micromonospora TaxID=2617518 RepID=UPI0033DE0010
MRVRRTMPEEGWTGIVNTAHRDYRLSWRARGLLGELLSYPDGWDTSVDKLVAQAREHGDATEGRAAMRKAVAELAEIGYVRYIREMDEKGHWSTVMSVCDVPQPEPDARRTRNRTVGAPDRRSTETSVNRAVGQPDRRGTETSGDRSITKKTVTKTVKKKDQRTAEGSEVECSPSGRFAPSGAGDESEVHSTLILEATKPRSGGWSDWRTEDYELFIKILGTEQVYSAGGEAGPQGYHHAHALYLGMQRMPDGKKPWPGKYLEAMHERGGDAAVDSWLAQYDLERA